MGVGVVMYGVGGRRMSDQQQPLQVAFNPLPGSTACYSHLIVVLTRSAVVVDVKA